MSIVFFVSSMGDTDLAKSTITQLIKQKVVDSLFIVPLTQTALKRTEDLIENNAVTRISIDEITQQSETLSQDKIEANALRKIMDFINENKIQHACIGVPSINNEIPFQIASELNIPCTIAYEYMFKPEKHAFWNYVDSLASKERCDFAAPLRPAQNDIMTINPAARVNLIGHLSLDNLPNDTTNIDAIKKSLLVHEEDELVFLSGTTQPTEIDNQFLDAILKELATGKHPTLQLRMGLHPGIKDPDDYLKNLLSTCEKYPLTNKQFKIILTDQMETRLTTPLSAMNFILRNNTSGPNAAQAAAKITQAVPGALLNQAALMGKPCYFHETSTKPYLPERWFSNNISAFFKAQQQSPHSRDELGLKDSAPAELAKLLTR
ncbi:MAG: hypothetical protein H0W64_10230 [Gammaproteobacteria bacterium]|nr:hypothetical protein [Gammaproteobacteria bacterium]